MLGQIGEETHQRRFQQLAQRVVRRFELQMHQRIFQAGYAAAVELVAEPVPWLLGGRV